MPHRAAPSRPKPTSTLIVRIRFSLNVSWRGARSSAAALSEFVSTMSCTVFLFSFLFIDNLHFGFVVEGRMNTGTPIDAVAIVRVRVPNDQEIAGGGDRPVCNLLIIRHTYPHDRNSVDG